MDGTKKCRGCPQQIPAGGSSRCVPCAEKHNAAEAQRRAARNPHEKWNAAQAMQRAKRYGAEGTWTNRQMSLRAATWRNLCVYCGGPATEADHFQPLAKGGTNRLENLVPSCGPCNKDKGDAKPIEWLKKSGKVEEVITRLLGAGLPSSPHAAEQSPHGLPTHHPSEANLSIIQETCSTHVIPTGFSESTSRGIYTPSSLEDRDGRAAAEWVNRVAEYDDANLGLVLTGTRDPFERVNRIREHLDKKGVGSVVAMLTDVLGKAGWETFDGVLLCPNLLEDVKSASRVEEVIEYRIANHLLTVVYIPPQAAKKPRFHRLIERLMARCHHYRRDPLPKRITEAEKEAAYEAYEAHQLQQIENEQIEMYGVK